ncbi:MAG: aminotransferase class V-fold PLP-dependent enzyme [Candidatus Bathyarchaeota archaeon]|nr:MAG: aminotransferase class V-fold PLP-dependent enzyme [Candidatus Bathyarchaeota archaeon]
MFKGNLLEKIRTKFPRAAIDLNGQPRIFFDNGTGTLVVGKAAKAETEVRIDCSANIGAGFDESVKAEEVIHKGRKAVADLLNAASSETIVTGESATALLFNLSYAIGKELTGTENVVTTEFEHYANISPWIELMERRKIQKVKFASLNKDDGTLNMDHLQSLIDSNTKIISVTAASNVLGTKSPLEKIGKMAKEVDAYFVVDAVHHIAHGPIDVKALNCDFLVFSGYKLFSSHGSFLYGKKDHLETLNPYKVAPASDHIPWKWERGTRNQSIFAAIEGVIDHLVWISDHVQSDYKERYPEGSWRRRSLKVALSSIEKYEEELSKAILHGLNGIKGLKDMPMVKVYGLTDLSRLKERDPTFAFKVNNMPDHEVAMNLWTRGGIAARAEDYYSRALKTYNQQTMIRISLVHYNTLEEVAKFLTTLHEICQARTPASKKRPK